MRACTEKCQFRTEKCQFYTEKCQFYTEKLRTGLDLSSRLRLHWVNLGADNADTFGVVDPAGLLPGRELALLDGPRPGSGAGREWTAPEGSEGMASRRRHAAVAAV